MVENALLSHGRQSPAADEEKVPAVQAEHTVAPVGENWPGVQRVQVALRAVALEKEPAGQEVQEDAELLRENVPGVQEEHAEACESEKVPGTHGTHMTRVE